ncbi:alpha/beta fold hydrolase [Myxococcus landrumensis]|uniref:Alpha/beta hydrolase n=1 Tax=Myxococcus landrumensis TaxID=2813577 RepID=A0ABX7N695_9BACT|nr:alpha/beta hydrolase [Myxococcus landrumus]QSQ13929.1 alpha/beta hydrolase [Myxococcus landrumus]
MPEVRASDGVRIRYDDVGRGETPLLFIPGWCSRRDVFRTLLPRCARRHRVLCVDLRGHGDSERGEGDFDSNTVLDDLLAVLKASGARRVVPVCISTSGDWALDLHRELGAARVPHLVLLDWLVTEPPPAFSSILRGLMSERWGRARDELLETWAHGVENEDVLRTLRVDMREVSEEMWARAAREITASQARHGTPLRALAGLNPAPTTLHLYAQPDTQDYLEEQVAFSATHPWFHVMKLPAVSHLPSLEVPDLVAAGIDALVSGQRTTLKTGPHLGPGAQD